MSLASSTSSNGIAKWKWSSVSLLVVFWGVCTFIVTISSFFQKEFINTEFLIPFQLITSLSGFLFSITILFYEKVKNSNLLWWIFYLINSILISSLMISVHWNQSMFLLLYLVNIVSAGLSLKSRGGLIVGLISLMGYMLSLIISSEEKLISHLFNISVNMISILMVSYLAGQLSYYLETLGIRLDLATKDIKKIKNLHELILSQIPSGVITIDEQDSIVQGNPKAKSILGNSIFKNENEWQKLYKKINESQKNQMGSIEFFMNNEVNERKTIRCQQADMILRTLDQESSNYIEENDLKGKILVFEDVSEIRKLEENLRNHEKLAAVGKLAAGIAHEIRNPLASISGSVQLLSMQAGTDEDKRLFNIVIRETDRLNLLITEFLDYAKPLPPPTDKICLTALLTEVLELVTYNKKMRTDIKQKRLWSRDFFIIGYKDKLKQALLNIIINAYQAMEKTENPELEVSIREENGELSLKIKDFGLGMNEETRKRIFEPFYTTKVQGTGLGLAVTHKIFEAHGASILVESETGKGTEFVIKIKEADTLKLMA